jgi:spore coat polysaccharide biosynthesis predicted glycosyltransferase SpsG
MHLLKRDGVPTRRLTVIANKRSTEEQQLDAVLSRWKRKVEVHTWVEPQGLADLFAGHEAALVSASTLAFEALATSTPIIALRTADNQARLGAHLQEMGIHVFDDTSDAAQGLIDGKASRQNDDTPFDGLGIWRVADALGIHQ